MGKRNLPLGASAEKAFAQLLSAIFDAEGLRRWIRYNVGAMAYQELPGVSASMDALVFETVMTVHRHGAVTKALFYALLDDRPGHADEIRRVAYIYGILLEY